jgi:hypothetical protein
MLLLALALFAACPSAPKTEAAVLDTEHHWAAALEHRDRAALDCIISPDFQDTTTEGELRSRDQILGSVADTSRPRSQNKLSDMHARIFGDVAVVKGLNHVMDGAKELAQVRFTDVFIYRDGRWQAVSGHETLVKD